MKNKTIEDAVRELDGTWNKVEGAEQLPHFIYLWFDDDVWRVAHPDSWVVHRGETTCTKEQFEAAAKKYHKEKVEPYAPQAGDWFLMSDKSAQTFLSYKYFCIGRNNAGDIVYECANGRLYACITENYKFKQCFLSVKEVREMQASILIKSISGPKDVINQIYQSLVTGKLPDGI